MSKARGGLTTDCIAASIAYDERLFRWELRQFRRVPDRRASQPGTDPARSRRNSTTSRRGSAVYPRVLSHRDYHGHNLFLQRDGFGVARLRVIDFQDALMAPAAQDLAVLLTTRDTGRLISPDDGAAAARLLLSPRISAAARRLPPTLAEFIESYRLCVLQHALKVIGRFIGSSATARPATRHSFRMRSRRRGAMLARPDKRFPRLRAAFA